VDLANDGRRFGHFCIQHDCLLRFGIFATSATVRHCCAGTIGTLARKRNGSPSPCRTTRLQRSELAVQIASSALAALATGLRRLLAILGEVARIVFGTAASAAVLTDFAAGLSCPFPVIREVARAVLPAELSGARRLLTILREVPRVSCMPLFGHVQSPCSSGSDGCDAPVRRFNELAEAWLFSRFL
jgi:hypothetical protein